ncbi:MAG: hypothetical protein C4294_06640 [Nitrospiraceae bacterium]
MPHPLGPITRKARPLYYAVAELGPCSRLASRSRQVAVETKRRVTGGVALVKALEARGVRLVFGIPGVHTLEVYDALYDSDRLSTILPRHEQGAGYLQAHQ